MKRSRLRKSYFFYNHIVLVVLIVLVVFLSMSLFSLFQKERESLLRKQETVRQLADVNNRRDALEKDIFNLETDLGKEALLRGTFDIALPGEEVIVLLDAPISTSTEDIKKGFWSFVTKFFAN